MGGKNLNPAKKIGTAVHAGNLQGYKNVFLTFLTPHGLTANAYTAELAHQSLATDCLFEQ